MDEKRLGQIRDAIDGDNGNNWWRLSSGDHLNMAEDLLGAYEVQAERVAALEAAVSEAWAATQSDMSYDDIALAVEIALSRVLDADETREG